MIILSNDHISNVPGSQVWSQGGVAVFAKIFSNYVASCGHHWVSVVVKGDSREKFRVKKTARGKRKTYIEVHHDRRYLSRINRAKRLADLDNALEPMISYFFALIEEVKPDIIFLNGFGMLPWMLMKAGHAAGVPIVIQHGGIWKKEIEMYRDMYHPTKRKILCGMEREISQYVDHEIFLNKRSWDVYNESVVTVRAKNASIIPLPCVSVMHYKKKEEKKDAYAIGIVARWDRIKNHEAVLRLAKEAKKKGLPWTFYAITSIPQTNIKKKFKNEYRAFIIVEKPKNRGDVTRFFQKMDLMILPSHFDVSPFVVIEAAMEGTPTLISPNVGHVDEYKKEGASRWVIDFSDEEKVVRRIKSIIGKPVPKKLVRSFEKLHDPKRVCDRYLTLFEQVRRKVLTKKI